MRAGSLCCSLVMLILAGCSGENTPAAQTDDSAVRIDCAIGPGAVFAPDCVVDRVEKDGQTILVVRNGDGGFRRFIQLDDGRGVGAADGADAVARSYENGILEVTVGEDRYRFPASVNTQETGNAGTGAESAE
ncbi:MAG: hypothetical protein ACK5NN_15895 [Sphingomonadaceae bacterium]